MECGYSCLSNFDLPPPESRAGRNKLTVPQALLALRHQPRVGRWVLAIGLGAGAVYGGFHYAVDALAGAALGVLIVPVAPMLKRRLGSGVSRA